MPEGINVQFSRCNDMKTLYDPVDRPSYILTSYLSLVSGPNTDDEKLVVEETGVVDGGKVGGNENSNTPDIEKFDRIRAAIRDKRDGPTGGAGGVACGHGPLSPAHNVFVGSGGVGMETNDGDGGDGKVGGAGDRVRLVSQWATGGFG